MVNKSLFTTIRIKKTDSKRIKIVTTYLNKFQRFGKFSADDVITMLLDSLEDKQQEASFVTAKEALKQ